MNGTDSIVDRRYSHRATAVDHLPIIIVGAGEPGLDPYDRVRQCSVVDESSIAQRCRLWAQCAWLAVRSVRLGMARGGG